MAPKISTERRKPEQTFRSDRNEEKQNIRIDFCCIEIEIFAEGIKRNQILRIALIKREVKTVLQK